MYTVLAVPAEPGAMAWRFPSSITPNTSMFERSSALPDNPFRFRSFTVTNPSVEPPQEMGVPVAPRMAARPGKRAKIVAKASQADAQTGASANPAHPNRRDLPASRTETATLQVLKVATVEPTVKDNPRILQYTEKTRPVRVFLHGLDLFQVNW